jgi:hypothetical protein
VSACEAFVNDSNVYNCTKEYGPRKLGANENSSYMLQEPDTTLPIWCHECGTRSIGSYNVYWQQCMMCGIYMCEAHADHDAGTRPPLCWLCKEACGEGDGIDLDLRYCMRCGQVAMLRKHKCLNRKCVKYICRPGAEEDFKPYQRSDESKNRSRTGDEMADLDRQEWGPRKRNKGRKRAQWYDDRMKANSREKSQRVSASNRGGEPPRGSRDPNPFQDEDEDEDEVVESSAVEEVPDQEVEEGDEAEPDFPMHWPHQCGRLQHSHML